MKKVVYVDGQEGTTGLQIHEVLATRSDIELLRIDPDKRKDAGERARLLNAADVAFLCLPDAAAREAAALVLNPRTCLIDASTAHRTAPDWVFGFPEMTKGQRERIRNSKRISNPGCHATAFIGLVRPLLEAGLLESTASIAATSITGYSGGGKKMIAQYESPQADPRLRAPRPYALGLAHKHIPEMMLHAGLATVPIFMPVVAAFYKGLAVTLPLHPAQFHKGATGADVVGAFRKHYEGEAFVRVHALNDAVTLEEGFFDIQASNDTNRLELFVFSNDRQTVLIARLDNLGKGASGAAIQSMNLLLSFDESLGLVK